MQVNLFDRIKDGIYQLLKSRSFVVIIAFIVLFAVLILKVFNLQIVKGQDYLDNYKLSIKKTKEIQGTRGNIYDCNGNLLAYNRLAYSVTIEDNGEYDTRKEKNKILNETVTKLIDIVESNGDAVISDFGIVLDANNNYVYAKEEGTQRLRFLADIYGLTTIDKLSEKQRNNTPDDIMNYLCKNAIYGYGINQDKLEKTQVLKMVNIRYAINLNSFRKYIATTIASDVSEKTVAVIMENLDTLQGVDITEDSLRQYTDSVYFASILGYTGKISQEEYDALNDGKNSTYALTDIVGKAGIEQALDATLQGTKGKETVYVDSVGNVIETEKSKESSAGYDLYLTIDKDLQESIYKMLEEKLAGIILAKMSNTMNYDPSTASDSGKIVIPIDDVYNAFFANEILNVDHFNSTDAGATEQAVKLQFEAKQTEVLANIVSQLNDPNAAAYNDLPKEFQAYMNHIAADILLTKTGILSKDAIDTNDATYIAWTEDENISLYTYINYAISKNWVDTSKLQSYLPTKGNYSDSNEVYQAIVSYLGEYLKTDLSFNKLIYKYMIKNSEITGTQICLMLYEQKVLTYDEAQYNALASGSIGPYDFIRGKIQTLEITPAQLALEPCTASAVVTDVNTGAVRACVSYPGYDNNRLANTMDSAYYNKLLRDLSRPFFNNATQEKTAPGSTYKMMTSVAGLTEGVISGSTLLNCSGIFDKVVPNPKCWIYPNAHGDLSVVDAISKSCNDFFYEVGYRLSTTEKTVTKEDGTVETQEVYSSDLGIEKLKKYATMFGLGDKSGLEITESKPQISDNYSVPSAIGQGTNNYTTSQLARYVATVANRGTVYNLTLLNSVKDIKGNVIKAYEPTIFNQLDGVSSNTWDLVQQGMVSMVNNSSTFADLDLAIAGKTGTAQQSKTHSDHALFVAYAPANAPEIALCVRIANGYSSSYAAELGKNIVKYKFGLADPNELITGQAASLGTTVIRD